MGPQASRPGGGAGPGRRLLRAVPPRRDGALRRSRSERSAWVTPSNLEHPGATTLSFPAAGKAQGYVTRATAASRAAPDPALPARTPLPFVGDPRRRFQESETGAVMETGGTSWGAG